VLTVLLTGLLSCPQVYLGQRVWPGYRDFPNVETAFMDVCQQAKLKNPAGASSLRYKNPELRTQKTEHWCMI